MRLFAHYERDTRGQPYLLEVSSDRSLMDSNLEPGDWIEEQQWIRFDTEIEA